ncbi:hypothetical protein [Undibacterium sp. TJN19]|uniref:hypothetical protein n=1 Tax=Undibacterium sp. TJN19 TaxID=3413055 RepID=UPI003BF3B85A
MTIDLTGAQIVQGLFGILILCLGYLVRQWMNRTQADVDSIKKKQTEFADKFADEFHNFQLKCVSEFAQKADISNGRSEMMAALHTVAEKVDKIYDKLDRKADKP